MNYFNENPDLVLTFDKVVDWQRVVPLVCGPEANVADTVATWRELLSVAGEYIGTEIAGRAKQVDEIGVIRDGSGLPIVLNSLGVAMIARACAATMVEFGIGYAEPAAMIVRFGTEEQKR